MKSILETERLVLREFVPEDSLFIVELLNSPGWLEFIGDRNIRTEEKAREYLESGPMNSYRANGFGLWLVETKTDHVKIGMCGIIRRDHLEFPDIGFAFLPGFMGKGYAYEIAKATLRHATENLGIKRIIAITIPSNVRSIRLLEKIGLKFEKKVILPNDEAELMLFSN